MNMKYISAAASMAYYTGMADMQLTDRAVVAARTGTVTGLGTFAALLYGEVEKTGGSFPSSEVGQNGQTISYLDHLKEKYGVVRMESIGRDQKSLDRVGATMGGTDVVIAPNMLEKMAADSDKAREIEGKIDYFFRNIPKYEMEAAAMGLTFESCGCVVHEDGTVTYICGGGDPPERVAEVNEINRKKREKEATARKESYERSRQAAMERRVQYEISLHRQSIQEISARFGMQSQILGDNSIHFIRENMVAAVVGSGPKEVLK